MTVLYLRDTQTEPGTGGVVHDLLQAQGTTAPLGSGNTASATFVEMRRFQRDVGTSVEGTSFPISINMASVSASTLEWRAIVQRLNSSNVVQAESDILGPFNTAGIKTGTLTLSTTWAAGDRLAVSLQLRKTGGGGNRSFSLNVNDADTYTNAALAGSVSVTPTTASLVLAGYVPTVTVSVNVSVTPTTASLVITGYAPSIVLDTVLVPTTASLVLTGYVPTVTVGGSVDVTPATASLVLTGYAPAITASAHVTVTPTTASLVVAGYAPSTILGTVLTPTTASLTATGYVPTITVSVNVLVTPPTASLVLTAFVPLTLLYTTYGAPFYYDDANWGTVSFYLEVLMRAITGTVYAQLINVTDGTIVSGSGVSTANASFTRLRSSALSPATLKDYRIQFAKDGSGEFLSGKLVVV